MKETRFRVWEKAQKVMLYDGFVLSPNGGVSFYWNKLPIHSVNAVLMQITGMRDKNGKHIWEGDVVSMVSYNYQHLSNKKWEVKYDSDDMMFRFYCVSSKQTSAEGRVGWQSFEVIGNIYENPELLTTPTGGKKKI